MKQTRELARFIFEKSEYFVSVDLETTNFGIIVFPAFGITTKTSKRKHGKKLDDKFDVHYNLIKVNNVHTLYKKIFRIFDDFLKDYDFVAISANKNAQAQRERIYVTALEKMGFKTTYIEDFIEGNEYFMSKKPIKKKLLIKYYLQYES